MPPYNMTLDEITLRALQNFNEHWITGKIPDRLKEQNKREQFNELHANLRKRQILSITGLRRVGKTTLMFQLIDILLQEGVHPDNILYFSFDEITAKQIEIIDELIQYMLSKEKTEKKETLKFIFFDEIQKVENWQALLKRYYDLKYPLKCIISGSESLLLKGKTKESLAGRNYEFTIPTLSFREFLQFKGIIIEKKANEKHYEELLKNKQKIKSLFDEFILKGGFPETVNQSIEEAQKYIKEAVIEKIIFSDIPAQFKITNPEILLKILEIASSNTSCLFELENLTTPLNINRNSASLYVSYLENSFLLRLSYNFTKSKLKQLRTSKKIYVTDTGIINALLKHTSLDESDYIGKLVETIVYNELSRKKKIFFWRDKLKHEVDIILEEDKILPIEIKYRNTILKRDSENIQFFIEKNNLEEGIIITKDEKKKEKEIQFIPAWFFLASTSP